MQTYTIDSSTTGYPEYEIAKEGPVPFEGGEAYRTVYMHRALTQQRATVGAIDILFQTPERVQSDSSSAAADFEHLRLQTLAESLTVR